MANWQKIWQELCAFVRETVLLQSTKELLEWDERTTMPELGGEYRAEQLALLSSLIHRRRTDPRLGDWLAELADSPLAADRHSDSGATIRQLRRDYDRQTRVPPQLVEELTRAASLGQQAWIKARSQHDFRLFQPHLQRLVELKRQEAEALGYDDSPYDALLDEFEPGARIAGSGDRAGRIGAAVSAVDSRRATVTAAGSDRCAAAKLPDRPAAVVRLPGCLADWIRFRPGPPRCHSSSLLLKHGPARLSHHDPL